MLTKTDTDWKVGMKYFPPFMHGENTFFVKGATLFGQENTHI